MTTLRAKALLFDLDGVLVDSTKSVEAHWREFAGWFDIDADQLLLRTHGVPHSATIGRELETLAPDRIDETLARFEVLEVRDAEFETPMPGAMEVLTQLPNHGWGVVTSCWMELALARADAAGIMLPDVLVTADQLTHGKPAPDGYLLGARLLGVDPANCIVFEDAPSGIEAALAAGATPVILETTTARHRLIETTQNDENIVTDLDSVKILTTDDGFEVFLNH